MSFRSGSVIFVLAGLMASYGLVATDTLDAQSEAAARPGGCPSGPPCPDVTCKDGTNSPAGPRACRGHGGVLKASGTSGSSSQASTAGSGAAAGNSGSTSDTEHVSCRDGTTSKAGHGACSGHGGVGRSDALAERLPDAQPNLKSTVPEPAMMAAPGGGPGMVWVNTSSKVYHCQGDRWYGKTKEGSYMTEAQAKASGTKPDHGKPCN
jgi:hypothetical protein